MTFYSWSPSCVVSSFLWEPSFRVHRAFPLNRLFPQGKSEAQPPQSLMNVRLRKTQISEMRRVYGSIQTEVALRVNKRGTLRKLLKKPSSVEDTKDYFSKEKDYFFHSLSSQNILTHSFPHTEFNTVTHLIIYVGGREGWKHGGMEEGRMNLGRNKCSFSHRRLFAYEMTC